MKITVICAAGKAGSLLVKEALSRGHDVKAVVRRDADKTKVDSRAKIVLKDLMDLNYDDLKDADAIIDAFGSWTPETLPLHAVTLNHLLTILSGKPNRLLIVGGAGSLYVDPELKTRLVDLPSFPPAFKPLASAMADAFEPLKKRTDVRWTYLCPSANFVADGPRTGLYQVGADTLLNNAAGNSEISYADYAVAMIDEAEAGKFVQKRFTVCSK